ncbi:MAG: T9SS type A sorting domain-containing protein [Flavobacteriales bacterium]
MRSFCYALVLVASPSLLVAQECDSGRYTDLDFFAETSMTTVDYGANTAVSGGNQVLRMDVYQPVGDVMTDRPVVIVAFGGSFIAGSRGDVADLCITFAKLGYVAVAPDYRVGFFLPNGATTTRAVMRGTHDMKAVVRFLRKSVVEDSNPFNIDPDRIITGGVSAGAISAIHAVYLDEDSEMPAILAGEAAALGGIEGNSGSPGYSSDVFACYSFSGAIADTSYIIPDDVPLASVHEVGDGIVPCYTQEVSVIGIPTGLIASGSHDIHERMNNIGVTNCFLSYPGTGHVGYLTSDPEGSTGFIAQFLADLVCGTDPICGPLSTAVNDMGAEEMTMAYPNPTRDLVSVELPIGSVAAVFDAQGRELFTQRASASTARFDLSGQPDGVYTIRVFGTGQAVQVIKLDQ